MLLSNQSRPFMQNIKSGFKDFFLLGLGVAWTTFNVYLLPFVVWTLGLTLPWFIQHDFIPYRDFSWVRTPFSLFLLSFWYRIFGVNQHSYQFFIFITLVAMTIFFFFLIRYLLPKVYIFAYLFYLIFIFPLFLNTEQGEVVLGLLYLVLFVSMFIYLKFKKLKWLFMSGFFGGIMYVVKQNSALIVPAVIFILVFDVFLEKRSFNLWLRRAGIFLLGLLIPVSFILFYFYRNNALEEYLYYTVFFLLGPYVEDMNTFNHGDGILIAMAFFSLCIPFVLFWKKNNISITVVLFLIALVFISLFSLFPSFLSYRAFPSFGLVSIIVGYNFNLLRESKGVSVPNKRLLILAVIFSFLIFIIFSYRFIVSYYDFIKQNNIARGQFITDYGENEYQAARWISENTGNNERIIVFSNYIVYLLADRLPKNKYIDPFPYALRPYGKTSAIFINNPPKIVVYDNSLPEVHKGLDQWPFISFMKKNYKKVKQYGDTTEVYEYKPK